MKIKIQIGFVIIALLLVLSVISVIRHKRSNFHDLPTILESGRLSVLTDSSRMGFSVQDGNVSGFQYEIVKAFADSLGLELVITEKTDLIACMRDLKSGDYDVLASLTPITTEWKDEALFSMPLLSSRQVLIQRVKTDSTQKFITNHYQLGGDTIYVTANSPHIMRLKHLSDEISDTIHIVQTKNLSTEQLVRMVSEGKIRYTICDELFAKSLKKQYPDLDVSLPVGFEQPLAWVVHLNSPLLLEKLNDFLGDFIGSSAWWAIYRKYNLM